jgi:hypothetical protein
VRNLAPTPFSGDLTLDVTGPGGASFALLLEDGRTLGPYATMTPEYVLPLPVGAPLGAYAAVVSALEGGTTTLGVAAFTFEVVAGVSEPGGASAGEALGVAVALDGPSAHASEAVAAPAVVSPNPATGRAALAFALDEPTVVRVALYDVLGREVALLRDGPMGAGAHEVAFDVSPLPAGVYVWRLSAGARVETGRLTVAR